MRLSKISLLGILLSSHAFAISPINPSNFGTFGAGEVSTLIKIAGVGADHHAYMPTSSLGNTLGIDMGIDVTVINVPTDFINLIQTASGGSGSAPSTLPLPKINIHKGLPFGLDIGVTFTNIPNIVNGWGADIKYNFTPEIVPFNLAARFSFNVNQIWFISTTTYSVDALISKKFLILEPYVGAGLQYWNGTLNIPASATQLPVGISSSASGINPRFLGGVSLRLLFIRIVGEMDYSLAGVSNYGVKASLTF